MNYCGEKFHSEVAKFRFLNELIKVLSPKVSTRAVPVLCAIPVPSLQTPVAFLRPGGRLGRGENLPTCLNSWKEVRQVTVLSS